MSDRYDPQAVEDAPTKSDYVTRKDAKWYVLLVVVAAIAVVPIYRWGKEQRNKALCQSNVKALGEALNLYAEQNDDRYPPLFEADPYGAPDVTGGKIPVTWASVVKEYHSGRTDLLCPAAAESERATTDWRGGPAPITYGMYAAHPTIVRANIDTPGETILIAETSSLGAEGTFDPLPYKDPSGRPIPDAFAIGWNDSNAAPTRKTISVTRLAFYGMPDGRVVEETHARHPSGIHAVTVSGQRVLLKPGSAATQWRANTLDGQWRSQP